MGFPGGSDGKASACNAGDPGSIPGLGRSTGKGNGNPLQCSCLGNPVDRGVWWATVHGVPKSQILLRDFHFTSHSLVILVQRKTSSLHLLSSRKHGDVPPRSLLNCPRNQYIFHLLFHFSQLHRATFTNESPP